MVTYKPKDLEKMHYFIGMRKTSRWMKVCKIFLVKSWSIDLPLGKKQRNRETKTKTPRNK